MASVRDAPGGDDFGGQQRSGYEGRVGESAAGESVIGEESRGEAVAGQGVRPCTVLVHFGGELAALVADPCPDHAEVQLGLLSALQDELETGFALIGHSIIVVSLQNPLLLDGEYRAEVHSLQAAPLRPGVHCAAGGGRGGRPGHSEGPMILGTVVFVLIVTQGVTYGRR